MKKAMILTVYIIFATILFGALGNENFWVRVILVYPYSYLAIKLYRN